MPMNEALSLPLLRTGRRRIAFSAISGSRGDGVIRFRLLDRTK